MQLVIVLLSTTYKLPPGVQDWITVEVNRRNRKSIPDFINYFKDGHGCRMCITKANFIINQYIAIGKIAH